MDVSDYLGRAGAARRATRALWWSIGLTLALYLIPFGRMIGYPLMLLSTLLHELGHGATAAALGGSFERLSIYADGSGVANYKGNLGPVSDALISAGGLIGPAIGAAFAFVAGRRAKLSRGFLVLISIALVVAMALVIRNPFGLVFTALVVAGLGYLALGRSAATAQLTTVFLAVQMALSVFSRSDYLFTDSAHTGAGVLPSDVQQIANALGGTYWMWGILCGLISVVVVIAGAWTFARALSPRRPDIRQLRAR